MQFLIVCPRCKGPIPDYEHINQYPGALSRVDNATEVCSACGTEEAMEQAAGILTEKSGWPIVSSRELRLRAL